MSAQHHTGLAAEPLFGGSLPDLRRSALGGTFRVGRGRRGEPRAPEAKSDSLSGRRADAGTTRDGTAGRRRGPHGSHDRPGRKH